MTDYFFDVQHDNLLLDSSSDFEHVEKSNFGLLDPLTNSVLAIVRLAFPNIDAIYSEAQIRAFAGQEADTRDAIVRSDLTTTLNNYKTIVDQKFTTTITNLQNYANQQDTIVETNANNYASQQDLLNATNTNNYANQQDSILKHVLEQEVSQSATDLQNFANTNDATLKQDLSTIIEQNKHQAENETYRIYDELRYKTEDINYELNQIKSCIRDMSNGICYWI